jgi:DMSO/TMAO reductase YedYZ molybdopterin-dependent catalytic subunit
VHDGEVITQTSARSIPRQPDLTKPIHGALVGVLLTAALVAVSFCGWKVAGLPFAPFDVFDSIVRALPGAFVTRVIELNVVIARALGVSSIGAAAKAGDQVMAVSGVLATGMVSGALLFGLLRLSNEPARLFGGILGAMLGGLALIAEIHLQRLPPQALAAGAWVLATFVAWGLVFGWTYDRLRRVVTSHQSPVTSLETERRGFLIRLSVVMLGTTAITTLIGAVAGRWGRVAAGPRWSDDHVLPNAASPVTPVRGTRAEFTRLEDHYRIDTDTRAPQLDADRWRLAVGGLVDRPGSFTLAELRALPATHQFITLSCISNPVGGDLIGTTRWSGVSLRQLLPSLALRPSATHLKVTSADGFYEVVALETIRSEPRAMLAYDWDGVPLSIDHGFPLRLYMPDLYGMKQPKWMISIDAIDHWEPGFWVARGWDREGHVTTTAAVDAVVRRGDIVEVGGFAYAGARAIARVEVRADEGEWQPAQIREPISGTTWVIWRIEFHVPEGKHRFTARALEQDT